MNIYLILLIFVIINIAISSIYSKIFIKNNFPKNILYPLKEDIELPFIDKGTTIPKKIYRIAGGILNKDNFQKALDKTQEIMSDYEQIVFDDQMIEDFIKTHYSERIWKAYDSIIDKFFPAKADLFRYLLIYKEGGIYIDIKSSVIKDLRPILEENGDKLLISHWINFKLGLIPVKHITESYWPHLVNNNYGEYQIWHVISPKGNPILRKVIKQTISNLENGIVEKSYTKGRLSVLACTGPVMYSLVISTYFDDKNVKLFNKNLNDTLKYKYIDHNKIMKNKHYTKLGNLSIFK